MSGKAKDRTDFYTLVHKGLRKRLFDVVVLAGTTDFADDPSRDRLAASVKDLVQTLRDHAENEETFLHPLLAEALPALAASLDQEHEEHDRALTEVERAFDVAFAKEPALGDAAHLAYRVLARFVAFYLGHLEREEQSQPKLWACVDEARLAAAMRSFRASLTLEQNIAGWNMILPALNAAEGAPFQAPNPH